MTASSFYFSEASIENAQPVFLVHCTDGVDTWCWTTAPYPLQYDGLNYASEPGLIVRKHSISDSEARSAKEIAVPWSNDLVQRLLTDPPDAPVEIHIVKGHTDSTWFYQLGGQGVPGTGIGGGHAFIRHWDGWLLGHQMNADRTAVLHGTPWWTDLGRAGSCLRSGISCQVPLYSAACGVMRAFYQASGTLLTVDGVMITAAVFGLQADGYYTNGLLETATHQRMIQSHTGTTVVLSHAIIGLASGAAVTCYPGCDHLWASDCKARYANKENFQGQPHRASSNMFRQGVL